jgi:enolase
MGGGTRDKAGVEISSISYRKILNSHAEFTNEFVIELSGGAAGTGAAPTGETISVYEDASVSIEPDEIIETMTNDRALEGRHTQESFDSRVAGYLARFGRNNCLALSLAFFNARSAAEPGFSYFGARQKRPAAPKICLNILNGGRHA